MTDFSEYQRRARTTAVYPGQHTFLGLAYASLGLAGEAGEVSNKVKKILRDDRANVTPERRAAIAQEIGDCQPIGTLVETPDGDARIEELRDGDRVTSYDVPHCRLRMLGSRILGVALRPYSGEVVSARTADGLESTYTPGHKCVVRMKPALLDRYMLYLMRRGASWRVGITRGYSSGRPTPGLTSRFQGEQADAIWILDSFADKEEALAHEMLASVRFGIPDVCFRQGPKGMGQATIDWFWSEVGDRSEQAANCLSHYGRDVRWPLVIRDTTKTFITTRPSVINAANLLDGMEMLDRSKIPTATGTGFDRYRPIGAWVGIATTRRFYSGNVHSLAVDRDQTYFGDGLATHNCLWYLANLCSEMQLDLAAVAEENLDILADRYGRDMIRGDGDER